MMKHQKFRGHRLSIPGTRHRDPKIENLGRPFSSAREPISQAQVLCQYSRHCINGFVWYHQKRLKDVESHGIQRHQTCFGLHFRWPQCLYLFLGFRYLEIDFRWHPTRPALRSTVQHSALSTSGPFCQSWNFRLRCDGGWGVTAAMPRRSRLFWIGPMEFCFDDLWHQCHQLQLLLFDFGRLSL